MIYHLARLITGSIKILEERLDHIKCQLSDSHGIITLSEVWFNNEIDSAPFRKDRSNNESYGGVLT